MSEAEAPVAGPLTFDAAVESLIPKTEEQPAEAAPVEPAPAAETEGADQTPEEPTDAPEEAAEGAETEVEAEAVEPAEPPKYWSKDAKEAFSQLPADLQAVVLAQEGPREEAAAKAKAEAAAVRSQADAEMAKVTQLAETLAEFLPQAVQKFSRQYGTDPDWVAYAHEHGAEAMTIAKAQYDADLADLQRLAAANETAQAQAQEAYVKAEFAKLAEIAPELTDPEKGLGLRQEVVKYCTAEGVDPAGIQHISAAEMNIARKAMLWDQAQALKKAAPKPKPAAPPQRAPVRPAAAATAPNPQRQARGRFDQAPTIDNAIALLLTPRG